MRRAIRLSLSFSGRCGLVVSANKAQSHYRSGWPWTSHHRSAIHAADSAVACRLRHSESPSSAATSGATKKLLTPSECSNSPATVTSKFTPVRYFLSSIAKKRSSVGKNFTAWSVTRVLGTSTKFSLQPDPLQPAFGTPARITGPSKFRIRYRKGIHSEGRDRRRRAFSDSHGPSVSARGDNLCRRTIDQHRAGHQPRSEVSRTSSGTRRDGRKYFTHPSGELGRLQSPRIQFLVGSGSGSHHATGPVEKDHGHDSRHLGEDAHDARHDRARSQRLELPQPSTSGNGPMKNSYGMS